MSIEHVSLNIAYGKEALQFGDLYLPGDTGPYPVVILIHGGFWRVPYGLALMTGLAKDLVRRGIAVWNIEYRRVGDIGGGWPGTLLDVAQAADYLQKLGEQYPLDLQRVVSIGHSAGGHLALWLAARPQLVAKGWHPLEEKSALAGSQESLHPTASPIPLKMTGVISLAGAIDLEQVWRLQLGNEAAADLLGGSPEEVPERYLIASPAVHVPLGLPQVLIHGTEDDRVPLIVSETYEKRATAAKDTIRLVVLDGADHFVLIDATSTAWGIIVEELRPLLNC